MKCDMCKEYFDDNEYLFEVNIEDSGSRTCYELCEECADKVRDYIESYYKKQKEKKRIYGSSN